MKGQKIYLLNAIKIENRLFYPIVSLKVLKINDLFINIDFTVLALKIVENDSIYFKNINLLEKDFEMIKKNIN